ncbi:MAG: FAD-dependent oxidoreductase, partial [Anaerolineales bacterium]
VMEDQRIAVVGGGVFGAAGALELRRRGHRVQLLDPGPLPHPDASSTNISKVIRMDYGDDEFTMALMEQAIKGWHAWNATWDETLYHEVGFLLLSSKPLAEGTYEGDSLRTLLQRGHHPERLDAQAITARYPQWSEAGFVDGYFNPEAGWAESGRVVARLLALCEQEGVELSPGQPVTEILREGGRVSGVRTPAGDLLSDWVVLAAGAWSPGLLPALRDKIWPVAQSVIHYRVVNTEAFRPPGFVTWAADIAETGWYGFPALEDGTLKVANHGPGRRIPPGHGAEVEPEDRARFRAFLREKLPAASDAPQVHTRVCFYSDSWDGDFYIDKVPDHDGLVVATGGSGHGFKFAPVLGGLIADALEGVENANLTRYSWRQPGEVRTEQARYASSG